MSTANIPSECHAWLLSLYEWWVGVAVPRRGGVGGFKQASWVQCSEWGILWAVNQSFIICNCGNVHPGPRVRRLPVGPPFQCSAVMLFNCKHNNNYYYLRQRNRHLQVSTATCCHLTVAGDFYFFFFFVAMLCWEKKNRTAGTYHGETWCRPCACGMATSCAELLCHSKHPRWWGRGFPHCYSQRLPLQETPIRGVMGLQCKSSTVPTQERSLLPPKASYCSDTR